MVPGDSKIILTAAGKLEEARRKNKTCFYSGTWLSHGPGVSSQDQTDQWVASVHTSPEVSVKPLARNRGWSSGQIHISLAHVAISDWHIQVSTTGFVFFIPPRPSVKLLNGLLGPSGQLAKNRGWSSGQIHISLAHVAIPGWAMSFSKTGFVWHNLRQTNHPNKSSNIANLTLRSIT